MKFVIVLLLVLTAASLGYQVKTVTSRGGVSMARTTSMGLQSTNKGSFTKVKSMTQLYAGIKKDEEEEFFESEMDKKSFKEILPIAGGFVAALSLPFIIGLIYLYANK